MSLHEVWKAEMAEKAPLLQICALRHSWVTLMSDSKTRMAVGSSLTTAMFKPCTVAFFVSCLGKYQAQSC